MSLNRFVRKIFPSISRLTYNPAFKIFVNFFDRFDSIFHYDKLFFPDNHLRIRIGVGNNFFGNKFHYYTDSFYFWMFSILQGYVNLKSDILDIGVGVGRSAHLLRDFNFCQSSFNGSYTGIDIDEEMIAWCRENFDKERFTFLHSSNSSKSYNQDGTEEPYRISQPDSSKDFIFSRSLYTHLLEAEAQNYLNESYRLLRNGGHAMHSVFCLDFLPPTYGKRHTFSFSLGNASVESLAQPEAAVAYTKDFLFEMAKKAGFKDPVIKHSEGHLQPFLILKK